MNEPNITVESVLWYSPVSVHVGDPALLLKLLFELKLL